MLLYGDQSQRFLLNFLLDIIVRMISQPLLSITALFLHKFEPDFETYDDVSSVD